MSSLQIVNIPLRCDVCAGRGHTGAADCSRCHGTGQVALVANWEKHLAHGGAGYVVAIVVPEPEEPGRAPIVREEERSEHHTVTAALTRVRTIARRSEGR